PGRAASGARNLDVLHHGGPQNRPDQVHQQLRAVPAVPRPADGEPRQGKLGHVPQACALAPPGMKAAVLDSPIAHSLSPAPPRPGYRALGLTGWPNEIIECDEAALPGLLDGCGPDWAGLSLTMPLKRAVLPLLDRVEPVAVTIGAANTVVFTGGRRHGHNTDVPGAIAALAEHGVTGTFLTPGAPRTLPGAGPRASS